MKFGIYSINVKPYVVYKGTKMTWDEFCEKCRLVRSVVHYYGTDNDPVDSRKCAACGETLPLGRDCILSWESGKIWCGDQCVKHYFDVEDGWDVL